MTDIADVPAPARPVPPVPPVATDRRDLRLYLAGNITSTFGSVFTGVAVSALAVDLFHVSGVQAGILAAAAIGPTLAVAPVAGALADRTVRPRRILISVELASAGAVSACGLAVAMGVAGFAWLVVLAMALGTFSAVAQTLFFTHVNSLRPPRLSAYRAQMQTGSYVTGVSAHAVAGPVVGALGPVAALGIDAVSYVVSAGTLRALRAEDHNPAHDPAVVAQPLRRELAEGVRVLVRSRLRPVLAYALLGQLAFAGTAALKALFLLQTLDLPLYLYSVPGFAAAALGALGSVLASRSLTRGARPGRAAAGWWACGALAALVLPSAGGHIVLTVALVSLGIAVPTMCGAAANVATVALFSEEIPERAMGRVNAAIMVVVTVATMAGALLAGVAADVLGVRGALWACAIADVVGLVLLRPLLRPAIGIMSA